MPSDAIERYMTPSPQTSLQVLDTLDTFAKYLGRSDVPAALALLDRNASFVSPDEEAVFRGMTGIGEYLEREKERYRNFRLMNLEAGAVGTVAWVNGYFSAGPDSSGKSYRGRVSCVLKGTGHAWVIVHVHLSCVPDSCPP
jgi:hypothetical protein